ncbi:MAG: sensor histidine kinase [Thermoplasmatota archaeon]
MREPTKRSDPQERRKPEGARLPGNDPGDRTNVPAEPTRARDDLARELARAKEDLRQIRYITSHDLRAPLRHIGGFAELLERRSGNGLDEESRKYLQYIRDGVLQLDALLQGLLRFERLEERLSPFVPVDMGRLVATKIDDRRARKPVDLEGGSIHLGAMPVVEGDPELLAELIDELLDNAVKFRGPRPAKIDIRSEEEGGGMCRISIRDEGIGFDPAFTDRIFLLFQRLHARGDGLGGAGVGLAVAKRIVEVHGGSMGASAAPGAGATFWFTLRSASASRTANRH